MNCLFDTSIKTDKFETSSTITGLVQFKPKEYFFVETAWGSKIFRMIEQGILTEGKVHYGSPPLKANQGPYLQPFNLFVT